MTKKTLLQYSLFPVSLIVLVAAILLACADGEIVPYPNSFFAPEISHNPRDFDFFVTDHYIYGTDIFKYDYTTDFHDNNIDEWSSFLKNKVTNKDLESIIYTCRLGEIDTLIFTIKRPGYPISSKLKNSSIFSVTDTRSALDFLYYIGYAKRCEKYSTYSPGYWEDEKEMAAKDPRNDKASILTLVTGGVKQIGNTSSDFVKQRYAFQVIRLYFQMKDYDSCVNFYNNNATLLNKVENTIRYRAMGYLAGAYMADNQIAEANFTYSIAFDRCDEMRDAAYFSFKPLEEEDFAQSLVLTANNRQKEVLWQMLGLSKDPLRAMKEIYKLDPKSDLLDLLLMRTVNLQEERFINQGWSTGEDSPADSVALLKNHAIDMDVVNFIKTVAKAGNTSKPYEWSLAAGYLDWACGSKDFETYFAGVATEAGKDDLVADELRLIRLLDKLKNGKAGDKTFEASITPELNWLKNSGHASGFRQEFAWTYVGDVLSQKYSAIKNTVISTCYRADMMGPNDTLLNALIGFIDRKDRSAFEDFSLTQLPFKKADLVEIQVVARLYEYDFNGAMDKIKEAPDAGMDSVYGDPFLIHMNDNHDSDASLPNKSVATRKDFIARMIELQKKAPHDGKNSAEDYFLLANGYYNMGYFGNNRVMYTSKISSIGDAGFDYGGLFTDTPDFVYNGGPYTNNPGLPIYMNCDMALQNYQKAMNASKDPEFKAKCCFMMAKCEQNYFFCHKPKNYKGDFKAGTYFAQLKSNYTSTQYYKEVIKECGYFKTYIGN